MNKPSKPNQVRPGELLVTVLDDGSVKIETDKVAPADHVRAERFLAEVQRLLGGQTTKTKLAHTHSHDHNHDHHHEGDHHHDHA